ncbi:MAG: UxaA family hydrolase [Roseimicrobium sp.]
MSLRYALRIHPADDLIVALRPLKAGSTLQIDGKTWTLREDIGAKHKFAARDFAQGEMAKMYGVTVGRTTQPVSAGALVHTHNLKHATDDFGGKQGEVSWVPPDVSRWQNQTFAGFRRREGRAGTANYWVVIPLVFCENRNLAFLREALQTELGYRKTGPYQQFTRRMVELQKLGASRSDLEALMLAYDDTASPTPLFANVDGVKFLEHGLGCGGTRQDSDALCALLAGYIAHPNVAGATVLSLGCQHAQVSILERELAKRCPTFTKPLAIFEQQKSASERDMMARALKATFLGIADANVLQREPCPISDLVVGVECGGSDGFSGISANPVIGHTADLLIALGGTAALSEFPELCGIEQELSNRCVTAALADRFVYLMRAYERAAQNCGSAFEANPSPGNIRDGLITDAIKSAGAAKKGGTSPVTDVLDYAEPITQPGLSLVCTPGNDVESTTALAGAGCTVMLFTTGLGTPTGNPVCPTLKIATNSDLAWRMRDVIDFDAGPVITGEKTVEEMGADMLELTLATASGHYMPKAVELGQDDFLPWKRGVSL